MEREIRRELTPVITAIKYLPQILLNYRLKSVRGFAIVTILCVCPL